MAANHAKNPIPEGFKRLKSPKGNFTDRVKPIYYKRNPDSIIIGMRVEAYHCSHPGSGGSCNGGMLVALVDAMFALAIAMQGNISRSIRTVSLNSEFIAAAPLGSWIEGHTSILRQTSSMVFVRGLLTLDEAPILQASGVFRMVGDANFQSSLSRLVEG